MTRLPAFVPLFCSSSGDSLQLKLERRFALELVRDGFVCEDNYKLLVACHCPELLLTTLDCNRERSSSQEDDEDVLIITTLIKILRVGKFKASAHLVARLGLLPWLRSFSLGRPSMD